MHTACQMAGSTECSSDSNILQRTLASKSITDACNKHNRTGLLNVQCKAKVKKGDEAAIAKWGGVGKHKVDKMEYSIWELEHLYSQIREKEAETHGLVRSNSTLHYSDGLRGSDLRLLLRCWVRFVQLQLCMHDGYGSLCGVCTLHVTLAWRSMVPDSVWVQAYSGQVQCMQETSAAFVTTRTRLTQSVATTGLMSFNEDLWTTKVAPAPNDVIWSNLALRGWERSIRNVISWVLFVVLIIMFFPIVALLQQIINLQSYAKDGNWAQTILDLPVAGRAPLLLHRLDPRPALLVFACASQRAASVCTMPESCVQRVYAYQLSDERKRSNAVQQCAVQQPKSSLQSSSRACCQRWRSPYACCSCPSYSSSSLQRWSACQRRAPSTLTLARSSFSSCSSSSFSQTPSSAAFPPRRRYVAVHCGFELFRPVLLALCKD